MSLITQIFSPKIFYIFTRAKQEEKRRKFMVTKPTAERLIIKAGMTVQNVLDSDYATPQQKRMAHIFDADGIRI